MTTPVVSSTPMLFSATCDESLALAIRAYRTKTSLVAVCFPQPGKGQIVFLPEGAMLRVIGRSPCLPEGFEIMFESQVYNVFGVDLVARSRLIHEQIRTRGSAAAACAEAVRDHYGNLLQMRN
jgi:hypothetical protein